MRIVIIFSMRVRGGGCAASRVSDERTPLGDDRAPPPPVLGDTARDRSPVKLPGGSAKGRTSMDILASLSQIDNRLVERVRKRDILILRVAWLCDPSVAQLERRQDLEERERNGEAPFLSPEEAEEVLRRGTRGIAALTHGWLAPGNPDPTGHRLQALRAAFAQLPHLEGLFWDYGSLPQVCSTTAQPLPPSPPSPFPLLILLRHAPLLRKRALLLTGNRRRPLAAPPRRRPGRRLPPRPRRHG